MTIQWSGEDETSDEEQLRRRRLLDTLSIGTLGHVIPLEEGSLPSPRSWRDISVIIGLILLVVGLGAVLWFLGPLPRVFPLIS